MSNFNLKQTADKLMKMKGNIRGTIFQEHTSCIRAKEGEKGIKVVEEKLKEIGYPLKFSQIKNWEWYPVAYSALVILIAKSCFNWTDQDVFEMGEAAPKYSLVVKLLMKYFLPLRRTLKEVPEYWRKYFDFGELEAHELNEKEKYLVLRLKNYKGHPLICIYHQGYFLQVARYAIKSKKITIEETKCMFKGDPYHEFVIRWE